MTESRRAIFRRHSSSARGLRFDRYEFDPVATQLYRDGRRVELQDKPLRALQLLLSNAGRVVPRGALRRALWPAERYLDFEHGLDAAIRKLRAALGDSARQPTYVETVRRRGYRFIAPVERFGSTPTAEPEALLKAHYLLEQRTPVAIRAALDTLAETAARFPSHPRAHALTAEGHLLAIDYGLIDERIGVEAARNAARLSLEIDPRDALAQACLAFLLHRYDWRWDEALEAYRAALDLDPGLAIAHQWFGEFLSQSCRHGAALRAIGHAVRLAPTSSVHRAVRSWIELNAGRTDRARSEARLLLRHEPRLSIAAVVLSRALLQDDRHEEATAAARAAVRWSGGCPFAVTSLAVAQAQRDADASDRALGLLEAPLPGTFASPYFAAKVYAARGDGEAALDRLEAAFDRRSGWLADLAVDRDLDPLRSDSRFRPLAERVAAGDTAA